MIGDGEEVLVEVAETAIRHKKEGGTKRGLLEKLSQIEGVYVPAFYRPEYGKDGGESNYGKHSPPTAHNRNPHPNQPDNTNGQKPLPQQ